MDEQMMMNEFVEKLLEVVEAIVNNEDKYGIASVEIASATKNQCWNDGGFYSTIY